MNAPARGRIRRALVLLVAVAALAAIGQIALAQGAGDSESPLDPEWTTTQLAEHPLPESVKNNLVPDALATRDWAVKAWKTATARYQQALARARAARGKTRKRLMRSARDLAPHPFAKPEYVVVWMGNANAGDENYRGAQNDAALLAAEPTQASADADDKFVPGLDGFGVLDARKRNIGGGRNPTYGKVVNFVQLPAPWGVEAEPHHMQYQWEDGDPLLAGGLFNTTTFVVSLRDLPALNLLNTIPAQETPGGTIPDAYDAAGGGTFIGTYMGGPTNNYGGSPGEVVAFKPHPEKGLVVASETPAGRAGQTESDAPGEVPEPCNSDEAMPAGTCANPHGIQVRPDIGRMVTSDYGEPKTVVLDPVKFDGGRFYRPTVRIWDTSKPLAPKLLSAAHMGVGWRDTRSQSTMHLNRGIMENAKTWPRTRAFPKALKSNGFFAGAMCGGGIFFAPDVTRLRGDSTRDWQQVWDDGLSMVVARKGNVEQWLEHEGPCQGGAWMQVTRNNRYLFRSVSGGQPNAENLAGQDSPNKIIYNVDITRMIKSARDGHIACDLMRGIDRDGDNVADIKPHDMLRRLARGKQVADCPRLGGTLNVDDPTTGGPHWAALDNHSLTADGMPTRLTFSNYFVARSGIDGDHKLYTVRINPRNGKLSYDDSWRDEVTGNLGVDFDRPNWPGNPGAGFYKPHSMVWACPPGICPKDTPALGLPGAQSGARRGARR